MNIDKVIGRRQRHPQPEPTRHTRKCIICRHPLRAEIDEDFLNWRNPHEIVDEYGLPNYSPIYRHARALGLTAQRNENARVALDTLVEKVETARVTGNTILRAIRAYSCLTDDGRWVEIPKYVIHESRKSPKQAKPPSGTSVSASNPAPQAAKNLIANAELETAPTR
jgi:hypothetical protein